MAVAPANTITAARVHFQFHDCFFCSDRAIIILLFNIRSLFSFFYHIYREHTLSLLLVMSGSLYARQCLWHCCDYRSLGMTRRVVFVHAHPAFDPSGKSF
jgi:hypothetical protein